MPKSPTSQITTGNDSKPSKFERSYTDKSGNLYNYHDNPMWNVSIYILMMEMFERFAYYGFSPTLQTFSKHLLGIGDADASSLVMYVNAVMYVTPIFTAIIADAFWGVYKTILVFSIVYALGYVVMCLCAVPSIGAPWMLYVALFVLISFGAGGIKSCVNVMGAHQFHPIHDVAAISIFFTYFYACINFGSIFGIIIVPIVQFNVSFLAGYLIPLVGFAIAISVFVLGNKRYVKMAPQGSVLVKVCKALYSSIKVLSFEKCKKSNGGEWDDQFINESIAMFRIVPILALVIPFMIVYSQMSTCFYTQGYKLNTVIFGWKMDPSMCQVFDPIGVLIIAFIVDRIYPILRKKNIMPSLMVRYSIGCMWGFCSVISAAILEVCIMKAIDINTISVWWLIPEYVFVAAGEIFLVATTYEVAFTLAPESLKGCASALNLIMFAIGQLIAGVLPQIFKVWMPTFKPDVPTTWKDSHYDYYFYVLAGISVAATILCLCCDKYTKYVEKVNGELLISTRD